MEIPSQALHFDLPATYRIQIKGYLDERWSDRLGGLTITSVKQTDGSRVTVLFGPLADQAALSGVLDTLFSLHRLPILSVEYVSDGYGEKL